MTSKRCRTCGAELSLRPASSLRSDRERPASCPLCGTDAEAPVETKAKSEDVPVDDYQAKVRNLREQLAKLREEDAEAV